MESERVKMESRGKLGNDEKVKFVGPSKNVRWREKACVSRDICTQKPLLSTLSNSLSLSIGNQTSH